MSEAPVFHLLSTDSALNALGLTSDTILGSANQRSPEYRPFAVLSWGENTPFVGQMATRHLDVWVYDEPGSYVKINSAIKRVREILCDENVHVDSNGQHFSTAQWRGDSPDLYDDIFKCVTRYASFDVL